MIVRDWLHVGCENGHDWNLIGGCNASCDKYCNCSVPVSTCRRCGDCDYGDTEEAARILRMCADRRRH